MNQRMVTMSAAKMASEIASAGRVALPGIYFDTEKTDVKPESEAALNEIAKLLTDNQQLKVLMSDIRTMQGPSSTTWIFRNGAPL